MRLFLSFLLYVFGASVAMAGTPNSIITPQTLGNGYVSFVQGTDPAGTAKTILTAGASGARCYAGISGNTNSVTHGVIILHKSAAGQTYVGTSFTTVANAGGMSGTPVLPQSFINSVVWPGLPVDQNGNMFVQLNPGDSLQALYVTALSASSHLDIVTYCSNF